MSRISILKRSIRTGRAGLVLAGLFSPANATYRHDPVAVFPDLPIGATADHTDGKGVSPAPAGTGSSESEPLSRRLGMKISLSIDIETPMLSIAPMPHEPKRPVMIHDSRFIAQMMDRALPRTSSHATIEAESAYPPQRTTGTRRRSVDKNI
jgi:hypothetical protein